MPDRPILSVREVHKSFKQVQVLRGVSFDITPGAFAVVYGLPGAGKSVLLRAIVGLESIDSGRITIRGTNVAGVHAGKRNIGYVPQSFALFPNRSVRDNIAYPLTLSGVDRSEISSAVDSIATMLQIREHLDKLPAHLSGGQKQRVAIARGLVKNTELFLLDDPLAGLDFKLRERLIDDLRELQDTLGATFIYTTSDPVESLGLAERLLALDGGSIVDDQPPLSMYRYPKHVFSAERVGFPAGNSVRTVVSTDGTRPSCEIPGIGTLVLPTATGLWDRREVTLVIKPEDVAFAIGSAATTSAVEFEARIQLREDLGGEEIVYLEVEGLPLRSVQRRGPDGYRGGDSVRLRIDAARIRVFDGRTGVFIANGEELIDARN